MDTSLQNTVVGLGELLWDCFDDTRRPGGAPANVAYHAGQLGCQGVVCTRVGRDTRGDELCEILSQQDINTRHLQRDDLHPTGTVTVDTSKAGQPNYVIHKNVAWDYLEFDVDLKKLAKQAASICFGTLAQRNATSRGTIHQCLASTSPDCLIVYDVNLRQRWYQRNWIEDSLRYANIVKLNDEEVTVLTSLLELGIDEPLSFAHEVRSRFDVRLVCVTRGQRGCVLVAANETIDIPGIEVEVADAVGAGDALTAALILTQLKGWPLSASAKFANEVGALVASRPGAMPTLRTEYDKLKAKYRDECGR